MIIDSFGQSHPIQRGICVERDWSPDGETELERRVYVRVRFVKTYDAMHAIVWGKWVETGIKAEVW
jgi:hypothetical protein